MTVHALSSRGGVSDVRVVCLGELLEKIEQLCQALAVAEQGIVDIRHE